jgi:hypothetical protein
MATLASADEQPRAAGLWTWRTAVALFAALVAALLAFAPELFNDGDTYWHIAAGQLIIDTRGVPATDPFSFTFRGQPWTAHEWLAEVLAAAAYRLGAWPAVAALHAVAVGVTLYLVGQWVGRTLPLRHALVLLVLVASVLAPFTLARPHVLAWPLLAGFAIVLLRARADDRAPPWPAAAIMFAWANLHASFALGLVLAALFGLEALLQSADRVRVVRQWGLFGLALLIAALATPHGVEGLLFPLQVSGMDMVETIGEWRATEWPKDWLFFVVAAGAGLATAARGRELGAVRLFILAALLVMAIEHARHQVPFVLVAALLLAPAFGRGTPGTEPARTRSAHGLFLGCLIAVALARQAVPLTPPDTPNSPGAAIAAVPPSLVGKPVLNTYGFGGLLIFNGIAPYIDGRVDMYGDAFLDEHQRMLGGDMDLFRRIERGRQLAWTIISPREPLAAKLDAEPGWRRIYADEHAVIHVRDAGE